MNSDQIWAKFRKVRDDFLGRCFVTCSASLSFYWCGDAGSYVGVPSLVQGLPLRLYVGLSEQSSKGHQGLIMDSFEYFVPSEFMAWQQSGSASDVLRRTPFRSRPPLECYGKALDTLGNLYSNELGRWPLGLKVHALSELPPHSGMNVEAAFAAALAASFLLATQKVSLEGLSIEHYGNQSGVFAEGSDLEEVFQLARQLERAMMLGHSSGAALISAVYPGRYPIFYLLAPNGGKWIEADAAASNVMGDYWAYPVDRLFDLQHTASPIDFGLIWSGHRSEPAIDTLKLAEVFGHTLEDAMHFVDITLIPRLNKDGKQSLLLKELVQDPIQFGNNAYRDTMTEVSMQCIRAFEGLLREGPIPQWCTRLFEAMNCQQRLLYMIGLSELHFDYWADIIRQFVNELCGIGALAREESGVKLSGTACGGDVLFAVAKGLLTDGDIEHLLGILPQLPRRHASLDYASWVDGVHSDGLVVNLPPNDIIAEVINLLPDSSCLRQYLRCEGDLEEMEQAADIIFNDLRGQIKVKQTSLLSGKRGPLTSIRALNRAADCLLDATLGKADNGCTVEDMRNAMKLKADEAGDIEGYLEEQYFKPLNREIRKICGISRNLIRRLGRVNDTRFYIDRNIGLNVILVKSYLRP